MKAKYFLPAIAAALVTATFSQAAVLENLRPYLVNHFTFDNPLGGDIHSSVEVDLGLDHTNINLVNGAPRVADGAWGGSQYSLQSGQINLLDNDDWKAGIQFSSSEESTLVGTKHVTGITLMGWFKPLGDESNNPSPNTNTGFPFDRFNAFGLFGLLRGDENMEDTDGHSVRALIEVIGGHITGLGRRLDDQPGSGTVRSVEDWDQVMTPEAWTHITATFHFDIGTVDLYKNGLPMEQENLDTFSWQSTGEEVEYTSNTAAGGIKIGGSFPDNSEERNPFNGRIDELMAFNKWLSPAEVLAQYQLVSGLPADMDADVDVDGRDLMNILRTNPQLIGAWEEAFGIGVNSAALVAVPEPGTLVLLLYAMSGGWSRRSTLGCVSRLSTLKK
jgi:hypothetical protein